MDRNGVNNIWLRRPVLTVCLLGIALAGAAATVANLPRTYHSQASVILLASRDAARQTGGNPYLSFTPSLTLAADAASRAVMAPATVQRLASRGFTAGYTVTFPAYATTNTGSVLLITVTGSDRAVVQGTMQAVISAVGSTLKLIQGPVRARDEIRVATLSAALRPALDVTQTARPIVVVALLGLLLVFGVPVLVDARLARRLAMPAMASPPAHRFQPVGAPEPGDA